MWQHTGSWVPRTGGPWCPREAGSSQGLPSSHTQEVPLKERTALKGSGRVGGPSAPGGRPLGPAECPLASLPRGPWAPQSWGGGGWLMMTWMTKSFWILVSWSRVRSVSSFPEKNHRCQDGSMPSWVCSCLLSCPTVSGRLALSLTSLPVERRTFSGAHWGWAQGAPGSPLPCAPEAGSRAVTGSRWGVGSDCPAHRSIHRGCLRERQAVRVGLGTH